METTRPARNAADDGPRWSPWKMALWAAPALFMGTMLTATLVGDGEGWSAGDFVFASVILYGALGAYEVVARMTSGTGPLYRAAAGLAIATGVMLVWSVAAVGLTDSDADGLYLVALAIGAMGTFVARFRPRGMARALFATALATASVGVIALVAGVVPPHNSAFEILGLSAFFVVLFTGSALLFREAAREGAERDAA